MKMTNNFKSCKFLAVVALPLSLATVDSLRNIAQAQIIPDRTLGEESSTVVPLNEQAERIEGGAARGSNLFHSFREFNIAEGRGAYFANPAAIENIFSRVTGSNPSRLLGTLGVLGDANLFFLNPNGIIFGKNASLDIRGSLVTSTANSLIFPDGERFSATDPQAPPLLEIDAPIPIGLQFEGEELGAIINAGELEVGGNLTLIGGTVASTGKLLAPEGEVTVSTVSEVEAEGNMAAVQLGEGGQILEQEMQPLAGGSSQTANSVLSWSELVADSGDETGLTVNDEGTVELRESGTTVSFGDIVLGQLIAQGAKLSATENLILEESQLGTIGDLTLLAQDTVRVRDSVDHPFIAAAGGQLLVQGDRAVDIFALNHPDSGLFAGGDLVLRSANTVNGDAHYWSGGNFRIEQLDGSLGNLSSPNDPIIRSQGDVSFDIYQGTSLHILAGGSVDIGTVVITGTDTEADTINPTATPTLANVPLSDGTTLVIDGNGRPTLDVRAGMAQETIGDPLGTIGDTFPSDVFLDTSNSPVPPPGNNPVATSADITIDLVFINPSDGVVFLTNQYEPNRSLPGGDITITGANGDFPGLGIWTSGGDDAGDVILDSRGSITLDGAVVAESVFGNGGDITLLANRDIILLANRDITLNPGASIFSVGLLGGNITLKSEGDISVTSGSIVSDSTTRTVADPTPTGGEINVMARSLSLSDGARLSALSSGQASAGNVIINASETVSFEGTRSQGLPGGASSQLQFSETVGNAGNIQITTGFLSVTNGARLESSNSGQGDAGNVTIIARDSVVFDGGSDAESQVGEGIQGRTSVGDSGDIEITAGSLSVTNGGFLESKVFGEGDAGSVRINATNSVVFSGRGGKGGGLSGAASDVESWVEFNNSGGIESIKRTVGNSQGIEINAGSLSVTNGAVLSSNTSGQGNAGGVKIDARDTVVIDRTPNGEPTLVSSDVIPGGVGFGAMAEGNSGGIEIETGSLEVTNGAILSADTAGEGDAGGVRIKVRENVLFDELSAITSRVGNQAVGNSEGIEIDTGSLKVTNGTLLESRVFGEGDTGGVKIDARDSVVFGKEERRPERTSRVLSGDIEINTGSLEMTNGAVLSSRVYGQGDAGSVTIVARDSVVFDGARDPSQPTGASTSGGIKLHTNSLSVTNGAQLKSSNLGQGDAGDVTIVARDSVVFDGGSRAESQVGEGIQGRTSVGDSGDIEITAGSLSVTNGGFLESKVFGEGDAGSVRINATNSVVFDGRGGQGNRFSGAASDVESWVEFNNSGGIESIKRTVGNSQGIEINAGSLEVTNGAVLSSNTSGQGDAGDVTITAEDSVVFDGGSRNGLPSLASSQVESRGIGNGGDIDITTPLLSVTNAARLNVSTSGQGNAGDVKITASDNVLFDGPSNISSRVESGAVGNAGSIELRTGSLEVTNGARLSTSTQGQGNSGLVRIIAREQVVFDGENIDGFASSAFSQVNSEGVGNSRGIEIDTGSLEVTNGAELSANIFGQGDAGNVTITAREKVLLDGERSDGSSSRVSSRVNSGAVGNGGQLNITTGFLKVTNGAQLSTSTRGQGNAGNITIAADERVLFDGERSDGGFSSAFSQVNTEGVGIGGKLNITTGSLEVTNGAQLRVITFGKGDAGNIKITADESVVFDGKSSNGDPSSAASIVGFGAVGKAGDIDIATPSLSVTDGALLSASTSGQGIAGSIKVTANTLEADAGGQLRTTTESSFNAGKIILEVEESITLAGDNSGLFANTGDSSSGNGGSIFIDPRIVIIQDGASVAVNSQGQGKGGDIDIFSESLSLDNGKILAETESTDGGNITLQIDDDPLLLRRESSISATAGNDRAGGNGGNIIINAPFIIAFPSENSDISANAFEGNGGKITIDTNVIFGIEERDFDTPLSDFTVSSELGVDGEIDVETLGIDPTRGLIILPEETVNTQISQGCQTVRGKEAVEYFEIGRGGLPPNPSEPLNADAVLEDWIELEPKSENGSDSGTNINSPQPDKTELISPCPAQ